MMKPANFPITQVNLQHCKEASSVLNNFLSKQHTGMALNYTGTMGYSKHIRGMGIFCVIPTGILLMLAMYDNSHPSLACFLSSV